MRKVASLEKQSKEAKGGEKLVLGLQLREARLNMNYVLVSLLLPKADQQGKPSTSCDAAPRPFFHVVAARCCRTSRRTTSTSRSSRARTSSRQRPLWRGKSCTGKLTGTLMKPGSSRCDRRVRDMGKVGLRLTPVPCHYVIYPVSTPLPALMSSCLASNSCCLPACGRCHPA